MTRFGAHIGALVAFVSLVGATDPDNLSCPANPNWGAGSAMSLTPTVRDGAHVLLAEGKVDPTLPARLRKTLGDDERISEIWLRSSGGDAKAGNEAGKVIRSYPGMLTRIPTGWACFSACNFVFMGGDRRIVEPGGLFIVHMFTHTGQRDVIQETIAEGTNATAQLIGEIEQASAQLASDDNDFLIRMGVSRKLLTEVMYSQQAVSSATNPATRYCLSQDEVRRYNIMPDERTE